MLLCPRRVDPIHPAGTPNSSYTWPRFACRGGLLPVDYVEPDITCVIEGQKFGIAAKRLKSLEQFGERVKEGTAQVRREKHPGIVAVDLTMAWNTENLPITSGLQGQLSLMLNHKKTMTLFDDHEKDILRWVPGSGVRAILTFQFTLRVSPDYRSWIHEGQMCWFPTTQDGELAQSELAMFQKAFLQGMPNVKDYT